MDDQVREYLRENGYDSTGAKLLEEFFGFKWYYEEQEIKRLKEEIQKKWGIEVKERQHGEGFWYVESLVAPLEVWDKVFQEALKPLFKIRKKKEEMIKKAVEKAKKTGKPVEIMKVYSYDGDDPVQVKMYAPPEIRRQFGELGVINVYLYAFPDGSVKEKHIPSY